MAGPVESLWARAVFSPVPVRNAFEVTVERLAQGIKLGVLIEGDRLPPERELSTTFGVSRVTLREAIKALRDGGLVESRRGRGGGTFVVSPKDAATELTPFVPPAGGSLNDTLDMRRVVEPGAAALAATRDLTPDDRATLRSCLVAASDTSSGSRRLADSRFHMAVAACAGSPSLSRAIADVQLRMDELLRAIPVLSTNLAHSDRQHALIVDAVLAGDAEAARLEMEEHVDGTAALLRGFLG
jgi:DNA-binding FadR family transcriptional regulator